MTCVEKELGLGWLTDGHRWLWMAGRPIPPHPLHDQLLLSREIFVTERMGIHLTWTTGRIFLKPIPRYLLEPRFWTEYLSCVPACECAGDDRDCSRRVLWKSALGFLFSYAALISHETDFCIAQEKHLLPLDASWRAWRIFVKELNIERIYHIIDRRFIYGELRLSRLKVMYVVYNRLIPIGSSHKKDEHALFHGQNGYFTPLVGLTICIAIILLAMQVGLATKSFADNDSLQSLSYGFTLFSIIAALLVITFIILEFYTDLLYTIYGRRYALRGQSNRP